ncbi:glutamine synthetase [Sphingomonas zeicaulis]|uniref:hypothetical protein n=1 Tax=Sphingomonas zeicaulis TaxID=1632740 RepID=UPI003D1F1DAD
MAQDLEAAARKLGIKYFLISFTDLFGNQRAKLVPAQAIGGMQKAGAGFAGFATWLDMTPADPDLFAKRMRWRRSSTPPSTATSGSTRRAPPRARPGRRNR